MEEALLEYGVEVVGDWTDEWLMNVFDAVVAVGEAFAPILFAANSADAFQSVYGGLTFEYCNRCVDGGFGWAKEDHLIVFDDFYSDAVQSTRLIVHELGHIFNRAVCNARECEHHNAVGSANSDLRGKLMLCTNSLSCLGRDGHGPDDNDLYWGFAGEWEEWQFGATDFPGEVFADMFVGWTYSSWGPQSRGQNRQTYMSRQMVWYLAKLFSTP